MDMAIQAELDKLTELIINAIPVEQIFLFGSYAYGTPHKDSDLDLYVVVKDDYPLRDLDAGLQISMAIARKKSMPVDIVAKKKKDFQNRLGDISLERVVNRDGICIYQNTKRIRDFLQTEIPELFRENAENDDTTSQPTTST
jgi:predicted nucleotidyltransferase